MACQMPQTLNITASYGQKTKNYIYRYWYENDAGDDQPVVLNVTFDTDNKYLYYSSTLIYPEYL